MAGKSDLVDAVAAEVEGLTKKQAREVVDAVFEAIHRHLERGNRVQVPGFGSFSISERAPRMGRNPATGADIQIPASRSARFKPAQRLRSGLDGDPTIDPDWWK